MREEDIVYSSRPLALKDMIMLNRAANGDWEALAGLLVDRTNLAMEEVLALDIDDIGEIAAKLREAIEQAEVLRHLGKSLLGQE